MILVYSESVAGQGFRGNGSDNNVGALHPHRRSFFDDQIQ
jgi:hypothetical protein